MVRFFEACNNTSPTCYSAAWQDAICNFKTVFGPDKGCPEAHEQRIEYGQYRPASSPASAWQYQMAIAKFLADETMDLVTCSLFKCTSVFTVGVASTGSQIGDAVALISGVSTPMILRKCLDGFQVIGPAFLPLIMDGQLWNEAELVDLVLV